MTKARVLLADDHALVRAGIHNALQEMPTLDIVGEVGDGPSLVDALARLRPDLVLVDVNMPDFDPLTAIPQFRARYPKLKILVVSAYDDDAYVQGLLGAGVNGYHLKDQPLSDLKLAVKRVLAGERWISSPLLDKLVNFSRPQVVSPPSLTSRQCDILRLLQQGLDNQSIANRLNLSVKTIENHLTRLYRQLNVQSRLEAVRYAMEHPQVLGVSGHTAQRSPRRGTGPLPPGLKLLLVDDNVRYRSQLRRLVGRMYPQAVIYEAEDMTEATRLAQRIRPQLVLMDVVLGEDDGITCTRRINAMVPESRIVLISAYPDREFHRLGLEAGAVAFLDKKDLDAKALRHIIDDMFG